jgi:TRAP transporter TAXI family solute receptor
MRKRFRGILALSTCFVFGAIVLVAQAASDSWKTQAYNFAGWPSSAGQYLWGAVTWSTISNDTGLKVTVIETAGTEENMHLLQGKKADIANYDAMLVKKTFGDKWIGRQVFVFAPAVWQFAVAKDANIKNLKDLNGKKWNPGPAGGGSTKISMEIVEMFGAKPNYHQATLSDAADAYADRQIVGFSYRGTGGEPTSAFVEANTARPLTFISLTDEQIAKIHEKWPTLGKFTVPANLYPGQTEPFNTVAALSINSIAASKDMPAEAVYEITKSYWKNFKSICKQFPGVCGSTPEISVQSLIPLHAGALRYYKEIGLKIPADAMPPEAK